MGALGVFRHDACRLLVQDVDDALRSAINHCVQQHRRDRHQQTENRRHQC